MIQVGNNIYHLSPMGWILCGKVKIGSDGPFVEWYE